MKPMWHFIKRLVSDVFATCLLLAVLATSAGAAELTRIGVTVTDLGNPFFVRIARSIEQTARRIIGPNVQVFVVSSASSRVICGRTLGMRRASIVLPVPGGPDISRL